jgi:SAM-dependent methyltransferase
MLSRCGYRTSRGSWLMLTVFQPHYVRDYRRMVRTMLRTQDRNRAMQDAVGGDYEAVGAAERKFLLSIGLRADDYLIDIGCGSGRLASALRDIASLRYLGTDVVPDLIDYAVAKCARPDWRFCVVDSLSIPRCDDQADMVVFFSVFTHLTKKECMRYLREAVEVARPGGQIVVSFLDRGLSHHRSVTGGCLAQLSRRIRGVGVKATLLRCGDLKDWGDRLGLQTRWFGPESIGQSICVYRKPT